MTKTDLVESGSSLDQLKIDIKNWEHEFKNTWGRQPDKQDIKQIPDIAAKYKEYHKAKRATAGSKENNEERESHLRRDHNRGRRHGSGHPHRSHNEREASPLSAGHESYHTPKRVKHEKQYHVSLTPTKSVSKVEYGSPYFGYLDGQQSITVIGPTPQAEGRVLGIFDITNSPDYLSQSQQERMTLSTSPSPESTMIPTSTHTKASNFTTPSKSNIRRTPQSVTPSYFRPLNTNKIYMTPSPLKPKKVSRGLTAILAELRQMQDEELDEQESIMREMEMIMPEIKKANSDVSFEGAENVVGIEDDGYHLGEIKEGDVVTILKESKEREAMMEKAKYKKSKTQKRTTRRVSLRPAKPMAEITDKQEQELMEEAASSSDDYEGSGGSDREVDIGVKKVGEQDSDDANRKLGSTRRAGGVSLNFKRLKMRNRNGRRFSRRRR
ncbi:DNA replication/checkpoint protein [Lipomyces chichibuensis]|uniref:DNA replication/checkpoint protein n=1 Tax=Lipomyces chichibuensis TaxID=1546026 RepID=UPI0033440B02